MNNLATTIGIREWTHQLDSLGRALLNGHINALAWQEGMHKLYSIVDLDTLLQSIDFEYIKNSQFFWAINQNKNFVPVHFLPNTGAPKTMAVTTKVAKIGKGRTILPHGHKNMVSAFLTLSGTFHVRQFDRLAYDEKVFYIRQTSDHFSQPGQWNSHSDEKNNIHWLTAMTDDTYLFSVKLTCVDSSRGYSSLLYVDPYGTNLGDGIIQAERIDFERANELFG